MKRILLSLILLLAIIPVVQATTITIHQGDNAYMGETVDLTQALSWPSYQFAVCKGGYPGCGEPKVYDLSSENQHNVYLDPARFQFGTYYRWDGSWHSAENMMGFRIIEGTRPVESKNITTPSDQVITIEVEKPVTYSSTNLYMARGDVIEFLFSHPSDAGKAYIWLFRNESWATEQGILGYPMKYDAAKGAYSWIVNQSISESLYEGHYQGFIQFSGHNGVQDVYYDPAHKNDRFEHPVAVLDTIYEDAKVPDVEITGLVPLMVYDKFKTLAGTSYVDDSLVTIGVVVVEPSITMRNYYEDGDTLKIDGITSLAPDTYLKVELDPDRYFLADEKAKHTWQTYANGTTDTVRYFFAELPIIWDELSLDNHTIRVSANVYNIKATVDKTFEVSSRWVIPTPTPKKEKIIVEEYGWHRITPNITAEPTIPAPTTIVTTAPTPAPTTVPVTTTKPPTTVPKPAAAQTVNVPIEIGVIVGAVFIGLWRFRNAN